MGKLDNRCQMNKNDFDSKVSEIEEKFKRLRESIISKNSFKLTHTNNYSSGFFSTDKGKQDDNVKRSSIFANIRYS
jgi:hypothetical protein